MGKKPHKNSQPKQLFEAFFSGLPYQATEEQLKQFIGSQDGIVYIKMPRYQDTNRCRGYAHVRFSSQETYKNALAKNGESLGERYLTVEPAKGEKIVNEIPSVPVGCKNMFVKGLPYQISEEELKKQFGSCGNVADVRMVRNSVNRNFKGFAYIDFKDNNSLKKAIKKYHNKEYRGRKLVCDANVTNMKKGYKKRDPNVEYHEQK